MRKNTRLFALFALAAIVANCGKKEDSPPEPDSTSAPTAYGGVREVGAYLEAVNPHIQRIGQLQIEYEQALASSRTDGTDRRGTGRNLAEQASQVRPQLLEVLEHLGAIEPPPLLAPFHRDARKIVAIRLEAYAQTLKGWDVEQAGGDFEVHYRAAETKLQEANDIILQLNGEMSKINSALREAQATSSPAS